MAGKVEQELRERVAMAHRVLYTLGLSDYLGHASARVPGTDRVVIKPKFSPRVRALGSLTGDRMILIDLDGRQLEGDDKPPAEVFIHTEIYRARPEVLGVVHTHQLLGIAFGVARRPILPVLHVESELMREEMPIFPSGELIVTPEQGKQVAQALGSHRAGHLRYHGIVTAAASVEDAALYAIWVERVARANLLVMQLGNLEAMPPEQMDHVARFKGPPDARWAYYQEIAERADGKVYPI